MKKRFCLWSLIEEKIWQQKSRATWINVGDANTKFFHAFAKERMNQNSIRVLYKTDGSKVQNQQGIKDEVVRFYRSLMGTAANSLPMVDMNIVERGPLLSVDHKRSLCEAVTAEEVKRALFDMDPLKSPGADGFNVYFFQQCWSIIGSSVVVAISDFFLFGKIPHQVNCTIVSLIPKIKNAAHVKDFRPIACCTILYKIISKILANRMQIILPDIINDSQSAFIKGRVIFDNIILGHELIKGYNRKNISPRCMIKIDL